MRTIHEVWKNDAGNASRRTGEIIREAAGGMVSLRGKPTEKSDASLQRGSNFLHELPHLTRAVLRFHGTLEAAEIELSLSLTSL
jgi:hypothetical protein